MGDSIIRCIGKPATSCREAMFGDSLLRIIKGSSYILPQTFFFSSLRWFFAVGYHAMMHIFRSSWNWQAPGTGLQNYSEKVFRPEVCRYNSQKLCVVVTFPFFLFCSQSRQAKPVWKEFGSRRSLIFYLSFSPSPSFSRGLGCTNFWKFVTTFSFTCPQSGDRFDNPMCWNDLPWCTK